MAKTQILDYYIHLSDPATAARIHAKVQAGTADGETGELLALPTGGFAIYMNPYSITGTVDFPGGVGGLDGASAHFARAQGTYDATGALPVVEVGEPIPASGGYLTSPWFVPGNGLPGQQRTFEKSSGFWFFGSTTRFYWAGHIVYTTPPTAGGDPAEEEPSERENTLFGFGTRYFHYSGDPVADGETGAGNLNREGRFGRTGDGLGLRWSDVNANRDKSWTFSGLDPVVVQPRKVWVRCYIRPVVYGSTTHRFLTSEHFATSNTGMDLGITPSGQFALFYTSGGALNLIATFGQSVIGEFTKIDLLLYMDASGNQMSARVYVNGEFMQSGSGAAGGLEGNRYWSVISVGSPGTATEHIFDIDDVVCAAMPRTYDPTIAAWSALSNYTVNDLVRHNDRLYLCLQSYTLPPSHIPGVPDPPGSNIFPWWLHVIDPIDFATGSHLVRCVPSAFGSTHASWTGDVRVLAARSVGISNPQEVNSTTANAPLDAVLDILDQVDTVPGSMGWVAFTEVISSQRTGALSGTLGYKIGAAAEVMAAFTQGGTLQFNRRTVTLPVSFTEPVTGTEVRLRHNKGNDANIARVFGFGATIECIGTFGVEDELVQADPTVQPGTILPSGTQHNLDYPLSPYARTELPFAPVIIQGNTYVGNNLGQDLSFPLPPTFLFIRPLTGDTGGQRVWAGMMVSHSSLQPGMNVQGVADYKQNLDFVPGSPDTAAQQQEYLVRIAGTQAQSNATGVTYQYIAWMDPAARFSRAHCTTISPGHTLPRTEALEDPEFAAEYLWWWREQIGTTTTATVFVKSAANAADSVHGMGGTAETANALTIGTGSLTVRAGLANDGFAQDAMLCFRRSDGNDDPNEARVMFLGSYTGDGSASRTVNIAPLSGRRPMFLIVSPMAAVTGFVRDPSHTGVNSTSHAGANSTTAITGGGIDSFSVGLALNANGTVYTYIGFPGSLTAGNGGWSTNGQFEQVGSDSRNPSDWVEPQPIEIPEPVVPTVPLVDEPDLEDDTPILDDTMNVGGLLGGQVCEVYTRRLVNRALGRIGITKIIDDLANDQTEYAAVARQHVKEDINAVLRDHPWSFATRYATLVLSSGSEALPFSNDWTYAYLAPNRMMFARRIAKAPPGRFYDYAPHTFRHYMSETLGPLILCNEQTTAAEPLVLEYTIRHDCPAFFGDAIFRDALVWRFAKSLASSLARDSAKAQYCETMYRDLLNRASTVVEREQQQEKHGDADWIDARR